jgi:hypothetical protein
MGHVRRDWDPKSAQANPVAWNLTGILLWSRQSDSNRRPADYKSAALPAELCRLLRGKILSDAASANRFLYPFSIRQLLTPLKASFWTRPEHTGRNSHRFGASATAHRLQAWSGNPICLGNAGQVGERV